MLIKLKLSRCIALASSSARPGGRTEGTVVCFLFFGCVSPMIASERIGGKGRLCGFFHSLGGDEDSSNALLREVH